MGRPLDKLGPLPIIREQAMEMIELRNVAFNSAGRLFGIVKGHPDFKDGQIIYPSSARIFDPVSLEFTSWSGKKYKILSFEKEQDRVATIIKIMETFKVV